MCNHFVLTMIKVCLNNPLKKRDLTLLELFQAVHFGITSVCICVIHGARKLHHDNDEGLFELPFEELDLALLCWAISGTPESHCSLLVVYIGNV